MIKFIFRKLIKKDKKEVVSFVKEQFKQLSKRGMALPVKVVQL